jgi:asparagine synthase (glutamine-hydrolysing)
MCGIAGILRWKGEPLRPLEIERMTKAINHRGPDGEGFLKRDRVALGHRRLAIIDLQSGQQPMSNGDETNWVTYNGEIYNYLELTHELQQKGYRFATRSDTEVVLHAYKEWGPECVKRFRGMFAFGLVDFKDRKILLARDHFGIKPLFYRTGDGYLAFGSELGALRHVDDTPPTGSLEAIDLYLRFQYIPTPHTIYREVHKLPPASYMLIDFDGHSKGPVRYWDLKFEAEDGLSDHDWEERAEAVIQDSVKAHLVADVPFGVFLSGGIDSSLVALEMSRILQRPLQAFTIGFDEKPYSEIEYAKEAAKRCGVELCSEIVRGDALRILPDLVSHYGEPFGDSSAIPTWYVSRLARRHVPMVLSGDGGDEAFGGYDSYANWIGAHPALRARRLVRSAPRASFRLMLQTMRRFLVGGSLNNLAEWQKHILYVGEKHRRLLWRDQYQDLPGLGCQVFEEAGRKAHRWNRLAYAQYLDYQTYLPCDILTKVDVASMYHGLEVRPPLVDVRVVELAARLPYDQRFGRNGSEGPVRKKLLKRILGKTFPAEFVHRKKQGFAIPAATWFLPGNSGRKLVEQVLTDPFSRLNSFFEPTQIRSYLQRHNEDKDTSGTLWLLLVLGLWLEQNPEVHF